MAGRERLVLPQCQVLPERRDEQEWYPAQQPQDASLKAAHRLVQQVEEKPRDGQRRALLVFQQAQTDESELPQAQSLSAQRASHSGALLQVHGAAP
jgi:hypothetical protein